MVALATMKYFDKAPKIGTNSRDFCSFLNAGHTLKL